MTATTMAAARSTARPATGTRRRRRILAWLLLGIAFAVLWEGFKWLAGDPWRLDGIGYSHTPPFALRFANDLSLPHLWSIVLAFVEPAQRNGPPLGLILVGQALFTFREALVGFAFGATLGLLLAILFVHSRLAERAFVPYVVASQTVPILAISPIIVVATHAGWLSVAIISMYLTFFPVTIGALRGLRAADPRPGTPRTGTGSMSAAAIATARSGGTRRTSGTARRRAGRRRAARAAPRWSPGRT